MTASPIIERLHETIDKTNDEEECLSKIKTILSELSIDKARNLCEENYNSSTQKYYIYYKYPFSGDALCRAFEKGHHKVMEYLLDEIKVNPNLMRYDTGVRYGNDNSTCLYGAVSKKNHAAMKILLQRGADPKIERSYNSTYYDSQDTPRDVTSITMSPICAALENKDLEAARLLLEHGSGNGINTLCVCDAYTNRVESESKTDATEMACGLGGEFVELFKQFKL